MTFIPVLAIRMMRGPSANLLEASSAEHVAENWLMRKAGYNLDDPPLAVLLCRMDPNGGPHQASYDPYSWGMARTLSFAHSYIVEHWGELKSGDVIDVEFLLGETKTKKQSERETQL